MHNYKNSYKIIGKYAVSHTIFGLAAGLSILAVRDAYRREFHHKDEIFVPVSPIYMQENLSNENKLYRNVFIISGSMGLLAGIGRGIKRLKSPREQYEEHDGCCHCHHHI